MFFVVCLQVISRKGTANSFAQLEKFKNSNYRINLKVIQYLFTADRIVTKSRL